MTTPKSVASRAHALILACLSLAVSLHAQLPAGHGHTGPVVPFTDPACDLRNPLNLVQYLTPFVDPLPIPSVAKPARTNFNYRVPVAPELYFTNGLAEYDVPMTVITNHQFHRDLPPVEVWGYAGTYPGPTFNVPTDAPVLVNWINQLPAQYPAWLPADTNLHGVPDQTVRSVVHLHGSASLPRYDGYPTNWYTTGHSDQYFYGNESLSGTGATLWYHDHAIGVTANNVYAGLAGFYLLRNQAFEATLNLPKAPYEIPLVFQDRDISTNCATPSIALGPFSWHNLNVVNGKVNPYLEVEPRKYRFRLLNGAGFRTYGFTMVVTDTNGYSLTSTAAKPLIPPAFNVIGSENGFLQQTAVVPPTGVTNSSGFTNYNLGRGPLLTMMPGERMDVIIDFSASAGQTITMRNIVNIADPTNLNLVIIPLSITNIIAPTNILNPPTIVVTTTNIVQITQPSITNLMQFRVSLPLSSPDTSSIPSTIIPASNWVSTATMVSNATVERNISLDFFNETPFPGAPFEFGKPNPIALLDMKRFADATAEFPHPGDTEIWNLVNLTMEAHPIHVHLLDFRVVDRARFSAWPTKYNGVDMTASAYRIYFPPLSVTNYVNGRLSGSLSNLTAYVDAANGALDYESGPKDVVRVAPYSVTRIVMTWPTDPLFYTTRSGTSPLEVDTDGRYIYHCHILDHEDSDMMRPLQLKPKHLANRQLALRLPAESGHGGHAPGTGEFSLSVETLRGEYYLIEATENLDRPAWLPLANASRVRGTGSLVDVTLPSAAGQTKFYRLKTVGNP